MGQITSRLTHDVEQVRRLLTSELAKLLSSGFGFAVTVAFMLLLSWRLTLAAFVVIPATMGVWGPLVKRLRRGDRRVLDLAGDVGAHIQETLSGIRVVKSSSAEDLERWRFRTITSDYHRTFFESGAVTGTRGPPHRDARDRRDGRHPVVRGAPGRVGWSVERSPVRRVSSPSASSSTRP